jgi:hypothetical protein
VSDGVQNKLLKTNVDKFKSALIFSELNLVLSWTSDYFRNSTHIHAVFITSFVEFLHFLQNGYAHHSAIANHEHNSTYNGFVALPTIASSIGPTTHETTPQVILGGLPFAHSAQSFAS